MSKVYLLDCTLRDGGYVNDWMFGERTIRGFGKKLAKTGVEMYEIGFIKGDSYVKDRAVFPDIATIADVISPKDPGMMYVGMVDMSAPIPLDRCIPKREDSVDAIRVIFKKNKRDEGYEYSKALQDAGYTVFVQFVGTDSYSDIELIETLERFNALKPFAMSIVDSFGLIKRKDFMRMVYIFDNNMDPGIALGYHAHNNLQLAFGNAEALVELGLSRDVCIDGSIFGMGRGAGNLNMELFADYMNENHGTHYSIDPMLEIMDEYLSDIYKKKFWGYSLPLYLSAVNGCHPNYAIYLAEKDSLTEKSMSELFRSMPKEDKANFSKEKAEKYYKAYQENYLDDKADMEKLSEIMDGKKVMLLAPGRSLSQNKDMILEMSQKDDIIKVAVNFDGSGYSPNFIFSSNMRRYGKIEHTIYGSDEDLSNSRTAGLNEDIASDGDFSGRDDQPRTIITSNMSEAIHYDYKVNFASYSSDEPDIIDNSGLMALKLLFALGVKEIYVAGMDGYSGNREADYFDKRLDFDFSKEADRRNELISREIEELKNKITIKFITKSLYDMT